MSLIQQIQQDQLACRKARNELKTSLLTTLLAEAAAVGKKNGNRESTDDEVIAVIKKFISNVDLFLAQPGLDDDKRVSLLLEKATLSQYLPTQLSEEEIVGRLSERVKANASETMATLMKFMKESFAGQYDGKVASKVAADVLAKHAGGAD